MSFATLAVIPLVAIVGPLLVLPQRWHLPVTLGEESWPPGSCWGRLAARACRRARDVYRGESWMLDSPEGVCRSGRVRISSYFRIL
jgi:hypothetical protein